MSDTSSPSHKPEDPTTRERGDNLLTTGDMARLSGNTLRTVRFYEEAGILRPDRRSAGGHRLFGHRELERLQFISEMRSTGLSLDEIRALLEMKVSADNGKEAASTTITAIDLQINALEQKIAMFERMRAELVASRSILNECKGCANHQCFPDECDSCDVIAKQSGVPKTMRVLWSVDGDD